MPIILEDGTGLIDSNSYADAAAGDAYHETRLYSTSWTDADQPTKESALMMASGLIDAYWKFNGSRSSDAQAMAWPRVGCPNRELQPMLYWSTDPLAGLANLGSGWYLAVWPSNVLPPTLIKGTCEMARLLIEKNRTIEPSTKGITNFSIGNGAIIFGFDKSDRPGVFPETVTMLLAPLGATTTSRATIPMVR